MSVNLQNDGSSVTNDINVGSILPIRTNPPSKNEIIDATWNLLTRVIPHENNPRIILEFMGQNGMLTWKFEKRTPLKLATVH